MENKNDAQLLATWLDALEVIREKNAIPLDLSQSLSWKITRPLREMSALASRARRKISSAVKAISGRG